MSLWIRLLLSPYRLSSLCPWAKQAKENINNFSLGLEDYFLFWYHLPLSQSRQVNCQSTFFTKRKKKRKKNVNPPLITFFFCYNIHAPRTQCPC